MNALGAVILVVLLYVVVALPRRGALLGMVLGVLYLTQSQSFNVFGVNMYALRFLEIAAFFRVLHRHEFSFFEMNRVDRALLWIYTFAAAVYVVRSDGGSIADVAKTVDVCLTYFAFRGLMRDFQDLRWFLGAFVLALIPYVAFLAFEFFAHKNVFALLGAAPETDWLRDERVRCFGSFRHPSLLGSVGAAFLPLYIALFWDTSWRGKAILGILLCTAIVGFSNSGGPLSAWAFGILGWGFWILRERMRMIRWGFGACFAILALVMKAPVYYILTRVSSVTGGDGWHRSYLFDVALKNFEKWGFAGMPVAETGSWFPYHLPSGDGDITNQFLRLGIQAGIGAIVLFTILLFRSFQILGQAAAALRSQGQSLYSEHLLWGLGVALAVHIVNWLGITYFDQFSALWMLQLATISSLSTYALSQAQAQGIAEPDQIVLTPHQANT